jgi:uncharacterized membrane protein (Fun14 family)
MMNIEILDSTAATIGGGFFTGVLVGYGLRQVVKFVAIIVGLFFALIYLQYQGIDIINWDKLQSIARSTISSLTGLITTAGNGNNSSALLPITSLGLPLTGSTAAGFAIGFMKG